MKKLLSTFFLLQCVSPAHLFSQLYKTIHINHLSSGGINAIFAAKFALFIGILLTTTLIIGKILKIFCKLPTVVGQIIGGIILGPSLINLKNHPSFLQPLTIVDTTQKQMYAIASSDLFFFFILLLSAALTVSYLLWLAGHETDIQDMARVGFESTLAGFLGAIVPIFMMSMTTLYCFSGYNLPTSLGIGLIFSATSVSIPITMLMKQNKMNLRAAKATMGAAIVDDIFAVILFSVFIVILQSGFFGASAHLHGIHESGSITNSLGHMLIAFIFMFILGKFFVKPTMIQLKKWQLNHLFPIFATLVMFFFFSLSELIGGLAGITGAYFAGVFHRIEDKKHRAVRAISPFVNSILLPIFLGSVGMQVNVNILHMYDWFIIIVMLIVATISKFLGCYFTTSIANMFIKNKKKKWSRLETYIFGASMATRGEVGLVLSTILKGANIISTPQYVICVTVVILTTIISPILLSYGFKILEKIETSCHVEYSITIGPFTYISSRYLFDIISSNLEHIHNIKIQPIVDLVEGKKILTAGKDLKIILEGGKGITFTGKDQKVKKILENLKNEIHKEVEQIPGVLSDH